MNANELERQIDRARRRLWLNRWLRQLGWLATFASGVFIVAVLVERMFYVGVPMAATAGALAGLAVLGSLIWLAVSRDDRMAAAQALDVAAGLRERVTSGLYCTGSDEPFSRSVYADAVRTVRRITVAKHLGVRYPRSMNWATCTTLAALVVLWVMPSYDLLGLFAKQRDVEERRQALKTTQAAIQQTVERLKERTPDESLLKDIETLADLASLKNAEATDAAELRRKAVKRLDELSEKLKRQKDSSESDEIGEIKKMLRRLDTQQEVSSAVDKLRQGLAKGDFKAAKEALKKIQEQLAKSKTPEDKAKAAEMQDKLAKLAADLDKLASQKRLADQLEKSGLSKKQADKMLENLSKRDLKDIKKDLEKQGLNKEQIKKLMKQIAKNKAACAKCKGLASSLGAASKGMKGSSDMSSGQAASDLAKASEQLSAMEMMEQEMADLEATLSELSSCKGGLCEGQGEGACPGGGMFGEGGATGGGMGALGRGRGGRAPRKETKVKYSPDRLKGQQSPGAMIGEMFVDGEQMKGQAEQKAAEAVSAAARDATEAIDRDRVPRVYHRSVKDYFGGLQGDLKKAEPAKKPSG